MGSPRRPRSSPPCSLGWSDAHDPQVSIPATLKWEDLIPRLGTLDRTLGEPPLKNLRARTQENILIKAAARVTRKKRHFYRSSENSFRRMNGFPFVIGGPQQRFHLAQEKPRPVLKPAASRMAFRQWAIRDLSFEGSSPPTRPDRIVSRGDSRVAKPFELLQLLNTGHSGTLFHHPCELRATRPRAVLPVAFLQKRRGPPLSAAIKTNIADSLNVSSSKSSAGLDGDTFPEVPPNQPDTTRMRILFRLRRSVPGQADHP